MPGDCGALADDSRAAHFRRLKDRKSSGTRGDASLQNVRVKRHRSNFGAADRVVRAQMTEGKVLDLICRTRAMTHSFDAARIEVVGVERPELEVPHDLGCTILVVGIDQWKRQAGDVALQLAIRAE